MLFSDQRHHKLSIPALDHRGSPTTIAHLVDHLCQHVMEDNRKELFVVDNHMYVPSFPAHTSSTRKRDGPSSRDLVPTHLEHISLLYARLTTPKDDGLAHP